MSPLQPGRTLVAVTFATIAIFGALVAGITWRLRGELRDQVLQREAEAIGAVALLQLDSANVGLAEFGTEFVIDDLFAAVLESSRLRGVLAVQLFDTDGRLRKAKPIAPDDAPAGRWWPTLLHEAQARFEPAASLDRVSPVVALNAGTTRPVPLLDIAVPLRSGTAAGNVLGVARYWVDGEPVRVKFAQMDRKLVLQAGTAFGGAALLVGLVLAFAFSRLAQVNRRLVEQSADLARANQELDFAAKTGALGAISAHLIHGLKNPLAGIEGFVLDTASGGPDSERGEACRTAVETTRRLRSLVNEVTTALRDETEAFANYAVPALEVIEAARSRAQPMATAAEVDLSVVADDDLEVDARAASLSGLVLANLVTNAIEASLRNGVVAIEARRCAAGVEFLVRDSGPGLPSEVQHGLFRPVRSSKRGGGGVGLAISHRLAKHAAGNLELVRSDARGTVFRLLVPAIARA